MFFYIDTFCFNSVNVLPKNLMGITIPIHISEDCHVFHIFCEDLLPTSWLLAIELLASLLIFLNAVYYMIQGKLSKIVIFMAGISDIDSGVPLVWWWLGLSLF